jgi:predicted secreted protein
MKILLILLAIAANSSCQNKNHAKTSIGSSMDTTIHVLAKDSFVITLPVSMGTGYRWELGDSLDKKMLLLENVKYTDSVEGVPGSTGTQTFVFRAINTGQTKIRLIHLQPWSKESINKDKMYHIDIK